jgi:hypothetical protein
MNADEPGLFDLPGRVRLTGPKGPLHGRNREAWTRTATAEVTILDAAALHEAVARVDDCRRTAAAPRRGGGHAHPGSRTHTGTSSNGYSDTDC